MSNSRRSYPLEAVAAGEAESNHSIAICDGTSLADVWLVATQGLPTHVARGHEYRREGLMVRSFVLQGEGNKNELHDENTD